jgi:hypothetical protein
MHLLLNVTGGGSAVTSESDFPAEGNPSPAERGSPFEVSRFSRLLAGQLAGSQRDEFGTEQTSARDDPRGRQVEPDQEADTPVSARSCSNDNPDQAPGAGAVKQSNEDGPLPWSASNEALVGAFEPWGGLAGLLQINQTAGFGNGTILDLAGSGGIPAEIGSRLAAEIAAHYSDRNGIQTLTLKLESEHLGQVDVRLDAKGDHLTVRLLAATRESEAALRENIKELGEAIQKRTSRFQQVEVRVDLKDGEDSGQDLADEDSRQSPDRDQHGETREDPDSQGDSLNRDTNEVETEPDDRAQGG